MKVIFNCAYFEFHKEYCYNIAEEIENRGGISIIAETENLSCPDADFTIQPDEACKRLGGKGVWIGHAFPVIPQNKFYLEEEFKNTLKNNSDYIFTFSKEWANWHKIHKLPTYVTGMPKLDKLFNSINGDGSILYAPTHHQKSYVSSELYVDVDKLREFGNVIHKGHPAFNKHELSLCECFKKSSIVISDYSSVGLEAIILNIPTILIGNEKWRHIENNHISSRADEAAIRIYNLDDLEEAIRIYQDNPKYLENKRLKYSKLLCEYQGNASKRFVDVLKNIL